MSRAHTVLRVAGPPILFGLAFIAVWELIVVIYDIKKFLLPAPSAIASAFGDNVGNVWDAVRVTGGNALVGLVLGTVVGVALSFALMRFRILNELVTPLAVALNAIPIIIVVPVLNNMFSTTSQVGRRLMVLLIVLFIVLVNVAKGLRQVSSTHVELMRSYAASPGEILVKIRIPNAVPYLFTALRIAAPLAVITAFVAEYFGGTQDGLGSRITSNAANSRNDVMWAYVIGACLLGLTFYLVTILIENAMLRQHEGNRSTTSSATSAAPAGAAANS